MNPDSTKTLWCGMAALSALCWLLLLLQMLGLFNSTASNGLVDRSWVSQSIVLVFGLCLVANARTYRSLVQHWNDALSGFKPDPSSAELRLRAAGLLGLHAERMQHIHANSVDGVVSQDVLLGVMRSRLYGEQWIVRSSAQLLLTLGLIGTVIGLAHSLDGLGATILASVEPVAGETSTDSEPSTDTDAVGKVPDMAEAENGGSDAASAGLCQAISGMGTAFATTLYGAVLGGVFLKFLVHCTQHLADELVNEIELTTEMELVPQLRLSTAQARGSASPGSRLRCPPHSSVGTNR